VRDRALDPLRLDGEGRAARAPRQRELGLRGKKLTEALQRAGVSQAGTVAQRRARLRDLQLYRERVEESLAESEAKRSR
jgi:hypothetical protein